MATTPRPADVRETSRPPEPNSGQKLMILVLSMTLFGLADMLTEIVPEVRVGPVELSVSYLAFVPAVMASLFHPFYAALGAPLGELVFGDLLMGDFSGIGELEGFIQVFLGVYIAGCLVRDPRRRGQVFWAGVVIVFVDKLLSGLTDIAKVMIGVDDAEFVPGLPESVLVLEGVEFLSAMVITGVLFGALPAMVLAPRLYGKIEPLLGLAPRDPARPYALAERGTAVFLLLALVLAFVSMIAAFTSEIFDNFGVWEPDFVERYGQRFLWIGVSAAVIVLAALAMAVRFVVHSRRERAAQAAEAAEVAETAEDPAGER